MPRRPPARPRLPRPLCVITTALVALALAALPARGQAERRAAPDARQSGVVFAGFDSREGQAESARDEVPAELRAEIDAKIAAYEAKFGVRPEPKSDDQAAPSTHGLPQLYTFYPLAGVLGRDAYFTNYVDMSGGLGAFHDWNCGQRTYSGHTGHDVLIRGFREQDIGVPVFAALDGWVVGWRDNVAADRNTTCVDGFNVNYVILDHGDQHYTLYLHFRFSSVPAAIKTQGAPVRAGAQIGLMGSSGCSTAPHLHFESHYGGGGVLGARNFVFEPFFGPCNSRIVRNNWTAPAPDTGGQQPYAKDVALSANPFPNVPSDLNDLNARTSTFVAGAQVNFRAELINIPAFAPYDFVVLRPDGSVHFRDARSFPNQTFIHFAASAFWFFNNTFPGDWRIDLRVSGQQVAQVPFRVVASPSQIANRAPNAITTAITPAAPTGNDVLACKVQSSLVNRDPDTHVVAYRYEWKVNGATVRLVQQSAAMSDVLPRNTAQPGQSVTCTVTPTDGALSGPASTSTSTVGGTPCSYTLSATSADIGAAGGALSVNVTAAAGCAWTAVSNDANFITVTEGASGNGNGTASFRVAANSGAARSGTLAVAGQTFTVSQAAAGCGATIYPTLQPFGPAAGNSQLTVVAANTCNWTAASNASWITVTDGASGSGTRRVRYSVLANTGGATRTGTLTVAGLTYTVTQTAAATTPSLQFSHAAFQVGEGAAARSVALTVTRTGNTNGAARVVYQTVDNPAAVPCNPADTSERGTAYARCDYVTTVDSLTFAAGETSKTFTVPLVNDSHAEGNETFQVRLSGPVGATLGGQTTATVTISDDDSGAAGPNPIRLNSLAGFQFFVRMQYLDFLSREPEQGEPWTNVLATCPNPDNGALDLNTPSVGCDRLLVSKSFFESPEFALKGRFIFLFHKLAFARNAAGVIDPNYLAEYEDIVADMRRVTGTANAEVIAKRLDFADEFVARPAFAARYAAMTNAQYVNALLANVGAALTSPDPQSGVTRNSLVADLNAGTKTRADVLRLVAESAEVNEAQFRHAYVAMQYYGYLRRRPEPGGYQAWLNAIGPPRSESPRVMIDGFMNSAEYRLRFGPRQ